MVLLIKITAIILFILAGIYLIGTGFTSPNGVKASMSHLFETESMFPYGVTGFLAGFQIAIFAFVGIELVSTTAAETKDRILHFRKQLTLFLYAFYYSMWARWFVLLRSHLGKSFTRKSPFVEMFTLVGLPIAAGLINFVVATSALSSANSGILRPVVCYMVWL